MKLPKIEEVENPLKSQYYQSIIDKPNKKYRIDRINIDWLSAELDLIQKIPEQQNLLENLIEFQRSCGTQKIPHFYSFFYVRKLLHQIMKFKQQGKEYQKIMEEEVIKKNNQIKQKQSDWHRIMKLIGFRENILIKMKLNIDAKKLQVLFNSITDLRVINFQVIYKIRQWKQANKTEHEFNPIFMTENRNYLIKIINDNIDLLNSLNSKKSIFLIAPNPFFLSVDGNKASMSQAERNQIEECMEILSSQKAAQLSIMLNPPKFIEKGKTQTAQELKNLKEQLQQDRISKIKKVYQSSKGMNSSTLRFREASDSKYRSSTLGKKKDQQKLDFITKNKKNVMIGNNKLEELIRNKEMQEIKRLQNSQIKLKNRHQSLDKKEPLNKYLVKAQLLKKKVDQANNLPEKKGVVIEEPKKDEKIDIPAKIEQTEKNEKAENLMRLSSISAKSNKLPKTISEIKAPKPKIKLLMEKQTIVEDVVKTLLTNKSMEMYQSMQVKKTAQSFFKPLQKVQQKQEESKDVDMKPITHYSRSASAANMSNNKTMSNLSLKVREKPKKRDLSKSLSNTSLILHKNKVSPEKQKKKKLSPQKQDQIQESRNIRVVNQMLREEMIKSAYEQKPKHKIGYKSPYEGVNIKKSKIDQSSNLSLEKSDHNRSRHDEVDDQLKNAKERIKNMAIYSIYGKKTVRENSSALAQTHKPSVVSVQKPKQNKKVIQSKNEEREALKSKIKAQTATQSNKFYDNTLKMKKQQLKLKEQNKKKEEELSKKIQKKQQLIEKLKSKDKRIEELLNRLKKEEFEKKTEEPEKSKEFLELQKQKEAKRKQIQQARQKMVRDNLQLKAKMEEEEKKFIALKEQEFKMKEDEMQKKYVERMESIKEDFMKKNKELEERILAQEKKQKENELKIMQQRRKMQEIEMQLQERRLKQQLLSQILKEQQELENMQKMKEQISKQTQLEQLRMQILEREETQRLALKNYEEENRKLIEMFEQMKKKNYEYELDNQRRQLQIKRIEEQARLEEQNLKKLEKQIGMFSDQQEKQEQTKKQLVGKQQAVEQNNTQNNDNKSLEDIEAIKQRVKSEILREMLAKKEIEAEYKKQEELERAKKIAELEEEIRSQMKRQEEQMERLDREQKQRYEKMKKQIQEEYETMKRNEEEKLRSQIEKYENEKKSHQIQQKQQNNHDEKAKEQQDNIIVHYEKEEEEAPKKQESDRRKQEKEIELSKEGRKQDQKVRQIQEEVQKEDSPIKQFDKEETQKNNQNLDNEKESEKAEDIKKKKNQQRLQLNKQTQQIQKVEENQQQNDKTLKQSSPNLETKQIKEDTESKVNIETQKQQEKQSDLKQENKKVEQQKEKMHVSQNVEKQPQKQDNQEFKKKSVQPVKQSTEEILTKYQNLQPYLTKSKQIYIEDKNISEYLTTFSNSMAVEVKEMLPYTKNQLEKIMANTSGNRKIDIFDTNSIGWLESQFAEGRNIEKYTLIGQIGCIESIVRKYGAVQIEMVYLFNKTNPYQKQFLTKQIKIFQKIGYIFQKKLKEDNLYSIKLIIKVPEQILPKKFKPPTKKFKLSNQLRLENHELNTELCLRYSVSYLLSQTLKNSLSGQQSINLKSSKSPEDVLIASKMHWKMYNDKFIKTSEIDDTAIQMEISLDLKYFQTGGYTCFVLSGQQYITPNNERIYISKVSDHLSIVVFQSSGAQFSLDLVMDLKVQKIEKQMDILVYVPIWKKQETIKLSSPGPSKFSYQHNLPQNLIHGSIIRTAYQKEQFKLVGAPFVFSIFQTGQSGNLLRPLYGEVVEEKNLVPLNH